MVFRPLAVAALVALTSAAGRAADPTPDVTFVFTSDVHFGLARGRFRGASYVPSRVVNAAEVQKINLLTGTRFPKDGGLRSGEPIGAVDFMVITGDIANRQELYPVHIQPAAASWAEFEQTYIDGLRLRNGAGEPSPLFLVPGNHDVSNAIGAITRLVPARDATSMVQIYNRMMHPATPLTVATFQYPRDMVIYSRELGGVHGIFLTLWPDSPARAWIDRDLATVPATEPVFIFCHDLPAVDPKHLRNPNGDHGLHADDGFENLLTDMYADGGKATHGITPNGDTIVEQRAFAAFLRRHRNIVCYFHGHENFNEVYTWKGPEGDLRLRVFRVGSPIKGTTAKEEAKLSFQVVTYNAAEHRLTDRECLWNARGAKDGPTAPVAWGEIKTVDFTPIGR